MLERRDVGHERRDVHNITLGNVEMLDMNVTTLKNLTLGNVTTLARMRDGKNITLRNVATLPCF